MLYGTMSTVVNSFFFNSVEESISRYANFLLEILMIRDGLFKLPSRMFSSAELKCIIDYVGTG
jgi:hypothetical protein